MLFLGSGVLENVARRYVWLRLLENGLLLQPRPSGTVFDRLGSPEYRLLCGGLGLMGCLHVCVLGTDGLQGFLGSAAALLILCHSWVIEWRLPSAADLLCSTVSAEASASPVLDLDFVKQLSCVSEQEVAAACGALPEDGQPTRFVRLAEQIRASRVTAHAAVGSQEAAPRSWAAERNWAMRFMGVPPVIALLQPWLQPLARHAQRLLGLDDVGLLQPLPVRQGGGFKAGKDRTFSARMNLWNIAFMTTVLVTQASCRGGPVGGRLVTTLVLAAVVALAAHRAAARY